MKAIEAFPISEEEARDLDELKKTFPDKSELRAVLEDYFHIYDDNASMEPQKFDMYFADFINDKRVDSDENERLNLYHRLSGSINSITNSRKPIKSAFKKGDKFENAYGATIVIDDPDANGRIQYVVRAGNSADCKSVDSDEKMQKILDDNGYIKSAKIIKSDVLAYDVVGDDGNIYAKGTSVKDCRYVRGQQSYYVVTFDNGIKASVPDEDDTENPVIESSRKDALKSALDPTEAQVFKETLIRAGYTEEQAQQILDQANQVEETQGGMMTSGCHGKQKKENKKDTKNRSISSAKNISIKSATDSDNLYNDIISKIEKIDNVVSAWKQGKMIWVDLDTDDEYEAEQIANQIEDDILNNDRQHGRDDLIGMGEWNVNVGTVADFLEDSYDDLDPDVADMYQIIIEPASTYKARRAMGW